jgi:hypothetical protein
MTGFDEDLAKLEEEIDDGLMPQRRRWVKRLPRKVLVAVCSRDCFKERLQSIGHRAGLVWCPHPLPVWVEVGEPGSVDEVTDRVEVRDWAGLEPRVASLAEPLGVRALPTANNY